jgi:hypothetical protein
MRQGATGDRVRVSPTLVEGKLHVLSLRTGLPAYDFDFELNFACSHPLTVVAPQAAVARVGALQDYGQTFQEFEGRGIRLINSVDEHDRASLISHWYPQLHDLTPRTVVWDSRPTAKDVTDHFDWPVFVKGERQTSRHQAALSIVGTASDFDKCMQAYGTDPILSWQRVAVREFVPLRPVPGESAGRIAPSFEFRTFWWYGKNVGIGRYWFEAPTYSVTEQETRAALEVAGEVASRISVPFLVVDVAMTSNGRWVAIECNDAQESGYAAISPLELWRSVIALAS